MSVVEVDELGSVDVLAIRRSELKKVLDQRNEVLAKHGAACSRKKKLQSEFDQMCQRYRAEIAEAESEVFELDRLLNHNQGSVERELIESSSYAGLIEEKKSEIKAATFVKGDPVLAIKKTSLRVAEDNFHYTGDSRFESEMKELQAEIAAIEARLSKLNRELDSLVSSALAE